MVSDGTPAVPCRSMSRYPVQDGLTGHRAPNVRSTVQPASLSDLSCHCPNASGKLERNPNRVREDGVRIFERTPKSEGWGAAVGSSWRTFGAPRPVLNPGLRQRDMKREDPTAAARHCGVVERLGPCSIPA